MNVQVTHPETLYQVLLAKPSRSERRNALTCLHEICRQRFDSGDADFSMVSIGKLCETQGFLKARVLYNASSADYKALIDAWAVFSDGNVVEGTLASDAVKKKDSLVSSIADPEVQLRVQGIVAERDYLRVQLSIAEGVIKLLSVKIENQASLQAVPAKRPRGRPLKNVSE